VQNIKQKLEHYFELTNSIKDTAKLYDYINRDFDNDYQAFIYYLNEVKPFVEMIEGSNRIFSLKIYSAKQVIPFSNATSNVIEDLFIDGLAGNDMKVDTGVNWVVTTRKNMPRIGREIVCYFGLKENTDSELVNVVTALFVSEEDIFTLLSKVRQGSNVLFIMNEKDELVTTTMKDSEEEEELPDIYDNIKSADDGTRVSYNNESFFLLKQNLSYINIGIRDWSVVYLINYQTVFDRIRQIWLVCIFLIIITISLTFLLLFIITSDITSRINRIVKNINFFKEGKQPILSQVQENDEIGVLEQNFNEMSREINRLIKETIAAEIKIKNIELHENRLLVEKKEAENIALRSQMNPHYLFNTLETIRMNCLVKKDTENAELIQCFSESFRNCLELKDLITIAEEIDFLEKYMKIQEYRYGNKISFVHSIDDDLLSENIPVLLLQPLVENAVYHGLEPKIGSGYVKVTALRNENRLVLTVEDNGVGISEQRLRELREKVFQSGAAAINGTEFLAFKNIHNRLRLLFGTDYSFSIQSSKDRQTIVNVAFPALSRSTAGAVKNV
jgi:two-component system sensor histidine kinase YesM